MIDERPRIFVDYPELGRAVFVPACEKCGRFVRADMTLAMHTPDGDRCEPVTPNATCTRCGRVAMIWEGFE